jgi:hypothetical protein
VNVSLRRMKRQSRAIPLVVVLIAAFAMGACAKQEADRPTASPSARSGSGAEANPPRFENAHIVLRPGDERAYIGYTIIGTTRENQYSSPERIRAVTPDGRVIKWKHQTETGGPADVVAMKGRRVVPAGSHDSGDEDYFDSAGLKIGQTIRVTFRFVSPPDGYDGSAPPPEGPKVVVPFRVVATTSTLAKADTPG